MRYAVTALEVGVIPRELFVGYVKDALAGFYDLVHLQTHPLVDLLSLRQSPQETKTQSLRQSLAEAIEALQPAASVPFGGREWLGYRLLRLRYIESLSQAEVCQELGLGRTAYYDYHRDALEAVTDILWERYDQEQASSRSVVAPTREPAPEDLAREEAIKVARISHHEMVDLGEFVEGIRQTLLPLTERRKMAIALEVPANLPRTYANPTMLRQIILNILTEGIELADTKEVCLHIRRTDSEFIWELRGLGIAPATKPGQEPEHILEASFGFAVSRGLLSACGGRIWCRKDEQGVLVLCFAVPIATQRVIVIMDDNADTATLYQRYLQGREYTLRIAHNAEELESLLLEGVPDLIMLDVLMPDEDGWNILQRLKTLPETASIPVVICSVLSQPSLALALGATRVLQKPIDQRLLLETVQALLDR